MNGWETTRVSSKQKEGLSATEFENVLKKASHVWGSKLTGLQIQAYWELLQEMDPDVFRIAMLRLTLRHVYGFPTPAHISLEAIEVLTETGALPPRSEEAWLLVMKQVKSIDGSEGNLPPLVQQIVKEMGSLRRFRVATDFDVQTVRKDFDALYTRVRQKALLRDRADTLPLPDTEDANAWRQRIPERTGATAGVLAPGASRDA